MQEWVQAQMDEAEEWKIGDVWMTENTSDTPESRFGGTWELIEARMLKNVGNVTLPTFYISIQTTHKELSQTF